MPETPPATPPLKPGYASTETYLALIGVILPILVAWGVVSQTASQEIMAQIPAVAAGIVAMATIWKTIDTQIQGRVELKKAHIEATAAAAATPTPPTTLP